MDVRPRCRTTIEHTSVRLSLSFARARRSIRLKMSACGPLRGDAEAGQALAVRREARRHFRAGTVVILPLSCRCRTSMAQIS